MKTIETFALFFAIFWGLVANVQPRWKAFQWPFFFSSDFPNVKWRVLLSCFWLNIVPVLYFLTVVHWLHSGSLSEKTDADAVSLVIYGVIPSFAIFGFYRLWLATVEWRPKSFYGSKGLNAGKNGEVVIEPAIHDLWPMDQNYKPRTSPHGNLGAAFLYVAIAVAPFIVHYLRSF